MNKNDWLLALSAVAMLGACARADKTGFGDTFNGSSGSTGVGSASGNVDNDSTSVTPINLGPPPESDATLSILPGLSSDDGGADASDAASSVVTDCVDSRTCATGACDELTVAGATTAADGSHSYIETMPDDGSAPPVTADLAPFTSGTPSTTGGPCIVEPPNGTLFPNNWARVRFNYSAPNPMNTIFQIRIHTARQAHDLVVYTRSPTWKLPETVWSALAASTWGEDITATVTTLNETSKALASSQVTFQIAPAQSNGTMVYWAAVGMNAGQSWLESFSPGDENAGQALTVSQVQWNIARNGAGNLQQAGATGPGTVQCIGCHVAVPDRSSVLFLDTYPWDGVAATVNPEAGAPGSLPSWLTPGGTEALSLPWMGMMSFSTAQWNMGNYVAIAASELPPGPTAWDTQNYQNSPGSLLWINLASKAPAVLGGNAANPPTAANIATFEGNMGTSFGTIARNGDDNGALAPAWSHDGNTIVYVSNNAPQDGRLGTANGATIADLYSVPYNGGMGGTATAIAGASDPNSLEYYPSLSPDDKYVVFNKAPGVDNPYYDPNSEVNVIPIGGGTATRLAANDPPSCQGVQSPGVTNSWPKFAPDGPTCGGKTYYWLIFSSSRNKVLFDADAQFGQTQNTPYTSQLYLTAIVDDGMGNLTTYPGVFIWSQHTTVTGTSVSQYAGVAQSNHTPQWEEVVLPPPPPPPPPPTPKPPR